MAHHYRVGEVAALTGVSVRTLHHYDQIGLLDPHGRSDGGHRLYGEADLLRLQQILTLRYLGFPLRQIGGLLDRPAFDLLASMRLQSEALSRRVEQLERIRETLHTLLNHQRRTGAWDWELVVKASAAVQQSLDQRGETMQDLTKQFEKMAKEFTPEERAEIERQWPLLIAEVRESHHLDPTSPRAQALADRWNALVQATFRGHQPLRDAVGENYRQGAYTHMEGTPTPEDFAFITRVNGART